MLGPLPLVLNNAMKIVAKVTETDTMEVRKKAMSVLRSCLVM